MAIIKQVTQFFWCVRFLYAGSSAKNSAAQVIHFQVGTAERSSLLLSSSLHLFLSRYSTLLQHSAMLRRQQGSASASGVHTHARMRGALEPARPLPSPEELVPDTDMSLSAGMQPALVPRSRCSASSSIRMRRSSSRMTLPCRRASVLSSSTWLCAQCRGNLTTPGDAVLQRSSSQMTLPYRHRTSKLSLATWFCARCQVTKPGKAHRLCQA